MKWFGSGGATKFVVINHHTRVWWSYDAVAGTDVWSRASSRWGFSFFFAFALLLYIFSPSHLPLLVVFFNSGIRTTWHIMGGWHTSMHGNFVALRTAVPSLQEVWEKEEWGLREPCLKGSWLHLATNSRIKRRIFQLYTQNNKRQGRLALRPEV